MKCNNDRILFFLRVYKIFLADLRVNLNNNRKRKKL